MKRLEEEKHINDISRERRLAQIEMMEEAAQKAMHSSAAMRVAESKRIDDELARVSQRAEYTLKQRQEEETLLNLENQTSNRIRNLQTARSEEERSRELRSELKSKEDKVSERRRRRSAGGEGGGGGGGGGGGVTKSVTKEIATNHLAPFFFARRRWCSTTS